VPVTHQVDKHEVQSVVEMMVALPVVQAAQERDTPVVRAPPRLRLRIHTVGFTRRGVPVTHQVDKREVQSVVAVMVALPVVRAAQARHTPVAHVPHQHL